MFIKLLFAFLSVFEYVYDIKATAEQLVCVLYIAPQYCSNCKEFQDAFTKSYSKVSKFSKFYLVNCESIDEPTESPFCTLSGRKILPKLACYHGPKFSIDPETQKENPPEEKIYYGKENSDSIAEFIRNAIPSNFVDIKTEQSLKRFRKDKSFSAKIFFYSTENIKSLVELRALSLLFKDKIGFARIVKPKLLSSFGFSDESPILFLELNGEKTIYEGELNAFNDLKDFVSPHALSQRIVQKFVDPDFLSFVDTENLDYLPLVAKYNPWSLEEILAQDRFVLVHIHRKGVEAEYWSDIIQRFGTMLVYYDFEIAYQTDEMHAKDVLEVTEFPVLRLFKVGEHKSHPKIIYKGNTDPDKLAQDFLDFVFDDSLYLQFRNSAERLGQVMRMEKHAVIYFSEKEKVSPAYKYISNMKNLTKDMVFFHATNPSKEFMQGYGIEAEKRPAIVLLQLKNEITPFNNTQGKKSYTNDIQPHHYYGEMTYGGIKDFLIPVNNHYSVP